MRKLKMWMLAAILICGTAAMFISCAANEDIPSEKTIADLGLHFRKQPDCRGICREGRQVRLCR